MVTQSETQVDGNSTLREEKFRNRLLEQYKKYLGPYTAEKIWETLLTREERTRLGSLEKAFYTRGRGVGIFARAKNISLEAATIEVSRFYGLPEIEYQYLCDELFQFTGERIGSFLLKPDDSIRFEWDFDTGILKMDSKQIRKVKNPPKSKNICRVLNVFQEEDWPEKIYNPFPGSPDMDKVKDTLKSLNTGLSVIRFRTAQKGEIIFRDFL